ncbi:protein S100-A1-like [Hyla sarda]|uniref:protein S100-A1-like n=1 Tax=Hyla sarda TaxID=327740 RepID=UPI0024C3B1E0|nr:protein S100-A1-like [Hyla sarda]
MGYIRTKHRKWGRDLECAMCRRDSVCEMAMKLQDLMMAMIQIYDRYASSDGDRSCLSNKELVDLAQAEFPLLCQHENKDQILKGVMGSMDMNKDNKVDFQEFCVFMCALTMALKDAMKK